MGRSEIVCILRVYRRIFFFYFAYAGKAWTALERGAKLRELLRRADGVGFDAAVAEIAHVAAQSQTPGFASSEEAEADALDKSGDEEALGLFRVSHKLRNCSRELENVAVRVCVAVPAGTTRGSAVQGELR